MCNRRIGLEGWHMIFVRHNQFDVDARWLGFTIQHHGKNDGHSGCERHSPDQAATGLSLELRLFICDLRYRHYTSLVG